MSTVIEEKMLHLFDEWARQRGAAVPESSGEEPPIITIRSRLQAVLADLSALETDGGWERESSTVTRLVAPPPRRVSYLHGVGSVLDVWPVPTEPEVFGVATVPVLTAAQRMAAAARRLGLTDGE